MQASSCWSCRAADKESWFWERKKQRTDSKIVGTVVMRGGLDFLIAMFDLLRGKGSSFPDRPAENLRF